MSRIYDVDRNLLEIDDDVVALHIDSKSIASLKIGTIVDIKGAMCYIEVCGSGDIIRQSWNNVTRRYYSPAFA